MLLKGFISFALVILTFFGYYSSFCINFIIFVSIVKQSAIYPLFIHFSTVRSIKSRDCDGYDEIANILIFASNKGIF
jgi:hypothetical protein